MTAATIINFISVTEADIKRFAPNARREYVTTLVGGLPHLRHAGILDNSYRLCHFLAQCAHETGGFTILRESLRYTKADRLRTVWPARFRDKSNAELAPLLKDEKKLGEAVYFGRMGNTQAGDGYDFRGGGFLQTTGRAAVTSYCKRLGLEPSASLLDDLPTTLQFAVLEWGDSKCNTHADENDLTKVSKAINTGSATGNVKPVGMDSRSEWFAKAWSIWGDKGKPDMPAKEPMTGKEVLAKVAVPVAGGVEATRQVAPLISAPPDLSSLTAWQKATTTAAELATWAYSHWILTAGAVGAYVVIGHVLPWWSSRR